MYAEALDFVAVLYLFIFTGSSTSAVAKWPPIKCTQFPGTKTKTFLSYLMQNSSDFAEIWHIAS